MHLYSGHMNITVNLVALLLLVPGATARVPYRATVDSNSAGSDATPLSAIRKQKGALASNLTIDSLPLKAEPQRISRVVKLSEPVVIRNETAGPFTDYQDYAARALSKVAKEVRHYEVDGRSDFRVVLTEEYAAALETLASDQANEHYIARVRPIDVPQLLDAMPDSRYFKRVFISENFNPEDDYVTQTYYPEGFVSSMAMTDGQLELYRAGRSEYLRKDVLHEWSHQLRYVYWNDKLKACFEDAVNLELVEWNPSIYATRGAGEQWAVLGERMLGYSGEEFLEACAKAPIRTVLWMRALHKCLDGVPEAKRSVDHAKYVARMHYVEKTVYPKAMKKLARLQVTGKTEFLCSQAKNILQYMKDSDWKRLTQHFALIFCLERYASENWALYREA